MCNCITDIEAKTTDIMKERHDGEIEGGKIIHSHFPLVKLQIKARITYSEFQYSFAPKKKDGTIGKSKKQTVSLSHSYCPFCGEKHNN